MTKGLIRKAIAGTALAGTLYFGGNAIFNRLDEHFLNQEDFDNAEWTKVYNPDGRVWKEYMETEIPHNLLNWNMYTEETRKRNKGNLEGWIYVPVFDNKE